MDISLNQVKFELAVQYRDRNDLWREAREQDNGVWQGDGATVSLVFEDDGDVISFRAVLEADFETQARILLINPHESGFFHLIPCNIHGDNNGNSIRAGEMPVLSEKDGEGIAGDIARAPLWEFRADRASHPVSILCGKESVIGISINPYSGDIRNGVLSALPNSCGVSLGYTNDPLTFLDKRQFEPSTRHMAKGMTTEGRIFAFKGYGKIQTHKIIRKLYKDIRSISPYKNSFKQAIAAMIQAFGQLNWSLKLGDYSNLACKIPGDPVMKPWRPLVEIGWTGGAVLAYPFMLAKTILKLPDIAFRKTPERILEEICEGFNEKSGLLFDVVRPWDNRWPDNRLNGWWAGFGLVENLHCAYTNGSAVYYLLKCYEFAREHGSAEEIWLGTAMKVLDTVIELQREDGAYGKYFSSDKKEATSYDGFSGCYFAACNALAYKLTGVETYLLSAKKAMDFYSVYVRELNCHSTPMDTWNAVDQEGNLAFIKAARYLHETTDERKYLDMAVDGANYEYLWRYAYKAKPELRPLKDSGFNSCGGSVTSISNPHIHPMGMIVNDDLRYIGKVTGDSYHTDRAADGTQFAMNILELYPEVTGYGAYGVLTERYCPSDGLTTETYSTGERASMWFSYNAWAAANVLEALCLEEMKQNGPQR